MTQAALLLDLDCSADDAGQFLYEDDARSTEPRRLALGTVLDLVASAFNMSATPEPIAFDARVAQLPEGALSSLRLELNPSTGAFAVHVAMRDQPNRYQAAASGQRFSPAAWPNGTFEAFVHATATTELARGEGERTHALRDDVPVAFGKLRAAQFWLNGVALQLSLTPAAREECARFSLHPSAFSIALRAAWRMAKPDDREPAAGVHSIERVAIVGYGAVPDGIAVTVDQGDGSASCTARATLFDAAGQLIAELSGIAFDARETSTCSGRASLSSERLAELAVESLGREVSPDANLLQLGLASLDLVRLVAVVYGEARVQVSLEAFLGNPTLEHLHALTRGAAESSAPDLAERLEHLVAENPTPAAEPAPLTSMQQALWLASLKPSAAPAYVECAAFRMHGALDIDALTTAWLGLQHFESLRSAILEQAGRFTQCVLAPDAALSCETASATLDTESAIETWLRGALARGFVAGERLARIAVLRLAQHEHVLLLAAHHAVCDGSSFGEHVIPELAARYNAAVERRDPPSVHSSAQPRHLAQWEVDPACAALLASEALRWARELSEVVETSELPGDRPRSPRSARPGRRHSFALSHALSERLESLARSQGHSQFAVTLALFGALLYRFAGLRDLLVGVPVAQRFAPSLTQAAGCLINFAPLRLRLDGQLKLRALVQHTASEVGRLLQRQRVPFQRVAKQLSEPGQESAANPRIGFSHEPGWPVLQLAGLELMRLQPELTHAKLDLFLRLEGSQLGWRGTFEYDADLFDPQTIVTLATRYVGLLERLVEAPDSRLMDLPWLGIEEQRALLTLARGPALPGAMPLPALLAARLHSAPDLIAVSDGARALSYAALAAQAEAVGLALREAGVQRGECVVLYLESCVDWPVAVFAAWRAGAAFVPIDVNQPRARQTHMFAIAQARVAISHARHCAELASFGLHAIAIDEAVSRSAANQTRASPDDWELRPDDLAFGIFTSGSTGLPKLALGNHGGLANKALAQLATFRLAPGVRVLQFASPTFDAALSELVLALSAGGTLWIPAREARYSGAALASVMQRERIEVAMLTPSVVATLPQVELPALRLLLVVGERCSAELVDHWAVGRDVYNLYGPTETTIWATSEYCQANTGEPTIGRAIPNAWVYVLDRDLNLLGAGQTGEICIGGAAVGSGYKHASDQDGARFSPDPYVTAKDARIYRTGDRGHFLPDGRLVFVGRDDDQVKLLGRRVALGEIESALRRLDGVQEAVVVVHEQGTPRARLSAFVHTRGDDISSTELRSRLRAVLPSPMIPASIAIVEDWPRLISGKIDRKTLALRAPQHVVSGVLTSAAEHAIAAAFGQVLGIDPASIGRDDDFFGLGGRSLDIVSLAEELDRVGVSLSVVELLQASRVSELATLIDADTSRIDVLDP